MNILSYRGPSTPGGVSATLSRVIEQTYDAQQWWFLHGSRLRKKTGKINSTEEVCQIPFNTIEGHYRYCNDFLWPVLHELPQYATFSEADKLMYQQMNKTFAWNVLNAPQNTESQKAFVNDYQLALTPQLLSEYSGSSVDVFWHIPWPRRFEDAHIEPLIEVATGLLAAEKIGFHIEEYAFNFLSFADHYLPGFKVDFQRGQISRANGITTQVVAHPLGIDCDFWLEKLREESVCRRDLNILQLSKKPFVLSVDRTDYTKGVFHRLQAIEHFFSANSDQIGKITFLQICQKTRSGLSAFDEYWQQCKFLCDSINTRWASKNWQPIIWIDTPVSPNVLAWLYKRASVMLVTAVYDGLNLTAKEFVLCSKNGVLVLSARTGAWHELNEHVLTLPNLKPETISRQVKYALTMSPKSRKERMDNLKQNVLSNSLTSWWHKFGGSLKTAEKVVPMSINLKHATRRNMRIAK